MLVRCSLAEEVDVALPSSDGNWSVSGLIHASMVSSPRLVADKSLASGTSRYWVAPSKMATRSPFGNRDRDGLWPAG
jgi:hypothetical protein